MFCIIEKHKAEKDEHETLFKLYKLRNLIRFHPFADPEEAADKDLWYLVSVIEAKQEPVNDNVVNAFMEDL